MKRLLSAASAAFLTLSLFSAAICAAESSPTPSRPVAASMRRPAPVVEDSVLVIPSGTRRIDPCAFRDRTDFHSIRLESPVRLSEIGEYAFLGCAALRELQLPATVSKIGQGAFRECGSLVAAALPGIAGIPRECFRDCPALQRVDLSRNCRDIASHAFAYCRSLRVIDIPSSTLHIGSNAFSFCSSLEEISLPANMKELESYAFSECIALRRATLPANGNMLGEFIFSGCRALEEITEPSPLPPTFDCDSPLFEKGEAEMFSICRLIVPAGTAATYRATFPWNLFTRIESRSESGK